jgi:hypothetical protein
MFTMMNWAGKWAELILSPIEKRVKLDHADPNDNGLTM